MISEFHSKKNKEQYESQQNELSSKDAPAKESDGKNNGYVPESVPNRPDVSEALPVKMESADAKAKNTSAEPFITDLRIKTALTDMENGGKAFQGWSQDNKVFSVVINKALIDKGSPSIKGLMEQASKPGAMVRVSGYLKKENLIYVA